MKVPFVHWICVNRRSHLALNEVFYCVETAGGSRTIVVVSTLGATGQHFYKPFSNFVAGFSCLTHLFVIFLKVKDSVVRIKFNIQITDPTVSIEATIFLEVASEVYSITPADAMNGQLALPMLHKLGEPKKCIITLKAYIYNYTGLSQIKFNLHSMSAENLSEAANRSEELLALPPNKKSKKGEHKPSSSTSTPANNNPTKHTPATEETSNSPNKNK
ncbi:hypothetical protein RHMOL_Rhmol03G0172000 [Rhododendron molle]|uniref:Uncharacterized protein n=1 Tax=Rhododendron molle TaxID=49168 RepID=A0ACC0PHP2_RHOML|nr:hypothetical protein RHMOL_Rhmol03G0172000 [Rhododendron molle]